MEPFCFVHFIIFFCLLLFPSHMNSSISDASSTYIIHMDNSLMPMPFSSQGHWYSSLISSFNASSNYSSPKLLYTYHHVTHGFSALLSKVELEKLKSSVGFLAVYPDKTAKLHTTHSMEFLSLQDSTGLWPSSKYGEDMIIGVVDTGIWPESPSFMDHGMSQLVPAKWRGTCEEAFDDFNSSLCNNKLVGARIFNKGAIANNPGVKFSRNSPRDFEGHGTHICSTAAGNYVDNVSFFDYAKGRAKGAAPHARLAIYKIGFWLVDNGAVYSSDIVAAIDKAVDDGVDILSLSFGDEEEGPQFYENPISIATFGAMAKGVFVATAGGNDGPSLGSISNAIPWTTTVAAATIDRSFAGKLILGNGQTITGWSMFPANALVEKVPLYYNESLIQCNNLESLPVHELVIIICDATKSDLDFLLVVVSGATNVAGAIFITDSSFVFQNSDFLWPGVVISQEYASDVIKYAKTANDPWATIRFQQTVIGTKPVPLVASFSSRGPSRYSAGINKPDLMAPGTLILAAYPPNKLCARIGSSIILSSDYNILSGTSMACPHVAGVAALLKGAHPTWSASAIRSAMMTTANPLDNSNQPIKLNDPELIKFASPLDMGSGLINPNQALDPGLVYDATPQDYVDLLCSLNYTKNQLLTIVRSRSYSCSSPSGDINYPSFMAVRSNNSAVVKSFQRVVTNVGNSASIYVAETTSPKGCAVTVSPDRLVFTTMLEKINYSLTIVCESDGDEMVATGSLIWLQTDGNHTVRSPIVVVSSALFSTL